MTRKQRELKEREKLILDTARRLLLEKGYIAMTMDRIAELTEYSKGTVYQHFSCKEDLMMELYNQGHEKVCELFERAAAFEARSRERMYAVGQGYELFVERYPHFFLTEMLIHTASIREKSSADKQELMKRTEKRIIRVVTDIVRDGVRDGDLSLPPGVAPEQVTFGLWAMSLGAYTILGKEIDLDGMGIAEPRHALHANWHVLLDGYGWRPFTREWDYERTLNRIRREVFPEVWRNPDGE